MVTLQLVDLATDFARAIEAADSRKPQAVNARSKTPYHPGIGPHTEMETVALVMTELADMWPERYRDFMIGLPYEEDSRESCDLALGVEPSWEWLIEVEMIRMLGESAKRNDNLPTHILSPYRAHHSAVTNCERLSSSGIRGRKAIIMYGYEPDEWLLEPLVKAFEVLALRRVALGTRITAGFGGLVHPVHQRGAVYVWEILSAEDGGDEEAIDAGLRRISHSFESLLYAAAWLQSQAASPAVERDQGWNAHIESFLIHARKLMDMLDPRARPRPDDIRLTDFPVGIDRIPLAVDEATRDQINKRLANITRAPILGESGQAAWPISAIRSAIVDAMSDFAFALGPVHPQMTKTIEDLVERAEVADQALDRDA